MIRQVRAPDGRTWTLRRNMSWVNPAVGQDFEHDVAPGYLSAVVLGLVLALLVVVLIAWTPSVVKVPTLLVALAIFLILWAPVRWVLRRPWTVIAEVPEDAFMERPSQRWVGTVRGILGSAKEVRKTMRTIELNNEPDINGALQPVD